MSNKIDENSKKEMLDGLKKIGLDHNEAVVYLSLLKLGEVGSSRIIKDTLLHGQTVYNALDSLSDQSLVRYISVKGRKKYIAQNPTQLTNILEDKKKIALEVAKKIESGFTAVENNEIEIYRGVESFKKAQFELLNNLDEKSSLLILGGSGDEYVKNMGKNMNEYEYIRNKKEVEIRYIGGEKQKSYLKESAEKRPKFMYRTLPDVFSGITNITVLKGYALAIFLFDESVHMIVIKNKKIVSSYTDFFETLWKLGRF